MGCSHHADNLKYENLATWLYNNYVQAMKIINEETFALKHTMDSLGITGTEDLIAGKLKSLPIFKLSARKMTMI